MENIRPWAHTANAVELPDGRVFVVWSAGQFEGSEDMVIGGAIMERDGTWQESHVVVDQFEMDGERWIPWCPTVLAAADGSLHVFFMGNPRSAYIFDPHPHASQRATWFMGDDRKNKMFHARLADFKSDEIRMLLPDEPGVNTQGRPLHLKSSGWAIPFDSMTTGHSHFLVLDEEINEYEKRGDIYFPPGSMEPSLVQLDDGQIICYVRFGPSWHWGDGIAGREVQGHTWKTISNDECRTFSDPIATNLRNPNGAIDIALSQSGRFLITYNDSYALRLPLSVGISDDLGRTFRVRDVQTGLSEPHYGWSFANFMYNCHAYPKLLQTSDEMWHLFYSHRYECVRHVWFEETWLEGGRKVVGLDE